MKIKFWGTRGSIPVPGSKTIEFGGNTSCVQVISDDEFIILDAGTGIRELGNDLLQKYSCRDIHLLVTHTHWDHIQGLPFFRPLYSEKCKLKIYSENKFGYSVAKVFETQWDPNYFPVTSEIFNDKVEYIKISDLEAMDINGFKVSYIETHHSAGTLAYRIEKDGKSLVYMTDNELNYNAKNNLPTPDEILKNNKDQIDFIQNADVLIHDSMYQIEDYGDKIGWGHSNNFSSAIFATLGNVKKLLLFHYDPDYTDNKIKDIVRETKVFIKELNSPVLCEAAYDGMGIDI